MSEGALPVGGPMALGWGALAPSQDSHDPFPDLPNCDLDFLGPKPLCLTP